MRSPALVLLFWASCFLTLGCQHTSGGESHVLLPEGDIARGEAAYLDLGCGSCHDVAGQVRPAGGAWPELIVALGGQADPIPSRTALATAIVNPSHSLTKRYAEQDVAVDGVSKMRNLNRVMTVAQLADLAAFLHSKYVPLENSPW